MVTAWDKVMDRAYNLGVSDGKAHRKKKYRWTSLDCEYEDTMKRINYSAGYQDGHNKAKEGKI